jgi:transcriptional regulator with XRE-family HTH domain
MISKEQAEATLTTLDALSESVKARRKALGISRETTADVIGIDLSTYARVEQGRRPNGASLRLILVWLIDTAWIEDAVTPAPVVRLRSRL